MFVVVDFVPYDGIMSFGEYIEVTPAMSFSVSILDTEDGVVEEYNQDSLRDLYRKCPTLKVLGVHAEDGEVEMVYVPREFFFKSTESKRYHVLLEQVTDGGCKAVVTVFDKERLLTQFKTHGISGKDWYLQTVHEYRGVLHILLKIGYGSREEFYALEYGMIDKQFKMISKSLPLNLDSDFNWYMRLKEVGKISNQDDGKMEKQLLRVIREAPIGTEFSLRYVVFGRDGQEVEEVIKGIRTDYRDIFVLVSDSLSLNVGSRCSTLDFSKVLSWSISKSIRFSLYTTQRDIDDYCGAGVF